MLSVASREVTDFDLVLRQGCQSQQRLFEVLGLLLSFVTANKLFLREYFVLQSAFHDVFADLLNRLYKQTFQLISFDPLVNLVGGESFLLRLSFVLQLPDVATVVGF